jgi:hypothetical protein
VTHSGLISAKDAKDFDENGKHPEFWCQGTNQEGFVRREWTEPVTYLIPIIEELQARMKDEFWIRSDDYDKKRDEDVRIIFFFDN